MENQGEKNIKEKSSIDPDGVIRFVLLLLGTIVYGIVFGFVYLYEATLGKTQMALIFVLIMFVFFVIKIFIIFRISSIKLKVTLFIVNLFLMIVIVVGLLEANL